MVLRMKYMGDTFEYHQPELAWYKRMLGMEYGPGWHVALVTQEGTTVFSDRFDQSPNPALVIAAALQCLERIGVQGTSLQGDI